MRKNIQDDSGHSDVVEPLFQKERYFKSNKMVSKFLKYLIYILLLFTSFTHQQGVSPETKCTVAGDTVCVNCITFGTCSGTPGAFTVTSPEPCTAGQYCDDTINTDFGSCLPIGPTDTDCGGCIAASLPQCIADVNDDSVILQCGPPVEALDCETQPAVDLTTCQCKSTSLSTTTETSTTIVTTTPLSVSTTPSTTGLPPSTKTTFTTTSTGPPSTTTSLTTNPSTTTSQTTPSSGSSTQTIAVPSTEEPTTPTPECTPDCSYHDDPSDPCKKYFICYMGEELPTTCQGSLCWNQTLCQCVLPISDWDSPYYNFH